MTYSKIPLVLNLIFRKPKLTIDCFCLPCASQNLIKKTAHFFPEWWKNLPSSFTAKTPHNVEVEQPTMKTCLGFVDLYKEGFVLPLWTDLNLRIEGREYSYQFASMAKSSFCSITTHPPVQIGPSFSNLIHFKIGSPWMISEKTGVKFTAIPAVWNSINLFPKMSIVPGVFDFKSQKATNINGFFHESKIPYQYNLEAGHPLLQLVPISDKKTIIKNHVLSEEEFNYMKDKWTPNKFVRWGMISRRSHKCPLH